MTLKKTLADLVAIDSVSSHSNANIIDYLAACCEEIGFDVKHFPYTDDNGIEKTNLLAVAAGNAKDVDEVELMLVGHTDTVPYDPAWHEALQLTERDKKLFGRGACDNKAFIAATLSAVADLDPKSLGRPFALLFTADEEIGLIGAKRFAAHKPIRARFAIVGEPTSLQPMRGGKGYCLAEVTVRGREAHSAYPSLGTSAVFGASRLIARIEEIAGQLHAHTHADFDPPYTTLNVGFIEGGTAKNVIPGKCSFTLEWRPIPGQSPELLLEQINTAIDDQIAGDPNLRFAVNASRADTGFETPASSAVVALLEQLTHQTAGTVAFGTEAAQMAVLGAEAVVLGPGNIREAHRTGEFVPADELERCVEILRQAIEAFCVANNP